MFINLMTKINYKNLINLQYYIYNITKKKNIIFIYIKIKTKQLKQSVLNYVILNYMKQFITYNLIKLNKNKYKIIIKC